MPRIEFYHDQDGVPVYSLRKSRLEKIKPIRTTAIALTTAAAIGLFAMWQSQDGQAQSPNLPNISTSSTPEPTQKPTLIIEVNTPIPKPPPTETPVSTLTPYPTPTRVPTVTPRPTPTLAPTPKPEPTQTPPPPTETPASPTQELNFEIGNPERISLSGITHYPDGHVSFIKDSSGSVKVWLAGAREGYLITGNVDNLNPDAKRVIEPSGQETFDRNYAAPGSVILGNNPNELLMFYHGEYWSQQPSVFPFDAGIGLAISKDGGTTWEKKGQILKGMGKKTEANIPFGAGQPSAIIKDKFINLYYTDWNAQYPDSIHLARAPIESNGIPGSWEKFNNGKFENKGPDGPSTPVVMGEGYAAIPGISFNTYLNKYIMVFEARDGFYMTTSLDAELWPNTTSLLKVKTANNNPQQGELWYSYPTLWSPSEENDRITNQDVILFYSEGKWGQDFHSMVKRKIKLTTGSSTEAAPTPIAATPTLTELQETCKEPGQNLFDIDIPLENPSGVSRLESIDVEYEFSNERGSLNTERYSVITKIKIPKTSEEIKEEEKRNPGKKIDPKKSISEGTAFPVPVRGLRVSVTGEIPPGANPGRIKIATAEVKIREQHASSEPFQSVIVAKEPCIKETLIAHFTSYNFNPQTKRVDSKMKVENSSGKEQLSLLKINTDDCSSDVAYIEAEGRLKNVKRKPEDPDLPLTLYETVAIPAKTNTVLDVYFTPEVDKTGKIPTELSGCTVDVIREFNKQSPQPEPKTKLPDFSKLFTFFSPYAKVKRG